VNVYPFIEAEKGERRNVKRARELLQVSRAAFYAARDGQPSRRDRDDARCGPARSSLPSSAAWSPSPAWSPACGRRATRVSIAA
jgi:hypothetical protein